MAINWDRYKRYDTSDGFGSASEWKQSFNKRMGKDEAVEILSKQKETPHFILGVDVGATKEQIKSAYRKKLIEWHPDKNPHRIEEATQMTQRIIAAYTVLTSKK